MRTTVKVQDDLQDNSVLPEEHIASPEECSPYFVWAEKGKNVVLVWSWPELSSEQVFLQKQAKLVSQGWDSYLDHLAEEAKISKDLAIKHAIKKEILERQALRITFLHC